MPTILVDLGKVEPISGVSMNMAAGKAQVNWPMAIGLFVGNDDKTPYFVGNLMELSAAEGRAHPDDGYAVHIFRTTALATRGRYVRFVIIPNGHFAFADEVEVHRGPTRLLNQPAGGRRLANYKSFCRDMLFTSCARRRLRTDASAKFPLVVVSVCPCWERQSDGEGNSTGLVGPGCVRNPQRINGDSPAVSSLPGRTIPRSGLRSTCSRTASEICDLIDEVDGFLAHVEIFEDERHFAVPFEQVNVPSTRFARSGPGNRR